MWHREGAKEHENQEKVPMSIENFECRPCFVRFVTCITQELVVLCAGAPEPRARSHPKFNAGLHDIMCQAASAAMCKRAEVGSGVGAVGAGD